MGGRSRPAGRTNKKQAANEPAACPIALPNCDIDRTFTHIFFLKQKNSHTQSVSHFYQNPVCLAKQYKHLIDSGEVKNQTDLAFKLGISKVRVCHVLSLLKLNDELIKAIEKTGNPMPTQIITLKMLKECLKSPEMYISIISRLGNCQKKESTSLPSQIMC